MPFLRGFWGNGGGDAASEGGFRWHLVPSNGSTVRKLGAYYGLQLPSGFAAGFSCDPADRIIYIKLGPPTSSKLLGCLWPAPRDLMGRILESIMDLR